MKKFLTGFAFLIPVLLLAQGPIQRQTMTTNQFMNNPSDGWIAIWNAVAGKWSNGVNTASSTNLPAYLQTATLTNLAGTGLNSAATNASALLPNMITTGISQGATNAGFYIASTAGRGTNTTLRNATNSINMDFRPTGGAGNYSTLSFYDDLGGLDASLFGSVGLNYAGGLTNGLVFSPNGVGVLFNGTVGINNGSFYSSGSNFLGATKLVDGKTANSVLGIDVNTNLTALSLSGLTYHQSGNVLSNSTATPAINLALTNDLAVAISNVVNDSAYQLLGGTYSVTPRIVGLGAAGYPGSTRAINLFNKTNITILGVPGKTIIDGSSSTDDTNKLGEILFMTNCMNVVIEGVTFKGQYLTNFTLYTNNAVWGIVDLYNCKNVTFRNCTIDGSFSHGMIDLGYFSGLSPDSTNVLVRGGLFKNTGSSRTNITLAYDGTAIVPTGWTIDGVTFTDNLRCVEPWSDNANARPFYSCVIKDCTMLNTLESAITSAGSTNGQNVIIQQNYIANDTGYTRRGTNMFATGAGIDWSAGYGVRIIDNQIYNYAGYGIVVLPSSGTILGGEISGNKINTIGDSLGNGNGIGIFIGDGGFTTTRVRGFTVKNNYITLCEAQAISIVGLTDSSFVNNYLYEPVKTGGLDAIRVFDGSAGANSNLLFAANTIIDGGTVDSDSGISIETANARDISIINNQIKGPSPAINNAAGTNTWISARGLHTSLGVLGLATNSFIYVLDNTNFAAGTFGSGLTFSGGTLTAAGGAASTNNPVQAIGTTILTNGTIFKPLDLGNITNITLSWNTNYYVASPSNNFTITLADTPPSTDGRKIFLKLINTNATSAFFPTNGLNGTRPVVLAAPSTNQYIFGIDTNGTWVDSGQVLTPGGTAAIQFGEGSYVDGTNGTTVKFIYDRTNHVLRIVGQSPRIILEDNTVLTTNEIGAFYTIAKNSAYSIQTPKNTLKVLGTDIAVTNIFGLIEKSSASVIELDFNAAHKFSITNRVTGNETLVMTNGSRGQEMSVAMIGEASVNNRTITIVPQLGHLVANLDTFGSALATSFSFTLTNGNAAEISSSVRQLNGTNVMGIVTRQFAF